MPKTISVLKQCLECSYFQHKCLDNIFLSFQHVKVTIPYQNVSVDIQTQKLTYVKRQNLILDLRSFVVITATGRKVILSVQIQHVTDWNIQNSQCEYQRGLYKQFSTQTLAFHVNFQLFYLGFYTSVFTKIEVLSMIADFFVKSSSSLLSRNFKWLLYPT